jgi:serine protease Do
VNLKVMRNGKLKTIKVKIAQLPDEDGLALSETAAPKKKDNLLGLELQPLTDEEKEQTELTHGLRILSVDEGPAKAAGIREGDILQLINGEKVETLEDLKKITEDLPADKFVSILVQRRQGPQFLAFKLSESEE